MKKITICLLLSIIHLGLFANDSLSTLRRSRRVLLPDRSLKIYDVKTPKFIQIDTLFTFAEHPAFPMPMNGPELQDILAEINLRNQHLKKDTLLTSDVFYIFKPYFEWLRNMDPHLKVELTPGFYREAYQNQKDVDKAIGNKRLPFILLVINDSVLIHKSVDPNFKKGDQLLAINSIPIQEYLKYAYSDRYINPTTLMINYYYSFAVDNYTVNLVRAGQRIEINTSGVSVNELFDKLTKPEDYNIKKYENAKTGYIQIKKFYPYNDRLIKIVHTAIKDFKEAGYTNVILDIRLNPGGSGRSFDKLLSIFINKPTIPYMKGQRLKVSKHTLADFDFLTPDMEGQLIDIPEKYFVKEFSTDPKMYIDGMTYYVLVSNNTSSMAATFANILQYNGAAKLVGEPLLRNALKYGEVIPGYDILPYLFYLPAISTIEFDEHTHAEDGILMPDIHIPYVAKEYITGEDIMLVKLLGMIKTQ